MVALYRKEDEEKMTILVMTNGMQITVENNKLLTSIVTMLDCTSLQWHVISDFSVLVKGKKELLYELLWELSAMYLGKIEII